MNARLDEIGPHEFSYNGDTPSIRWYGLAELGQGWTDFGLSFRLILEGRPDPLRVASALDALCDEWDRLRARWPELLPELKSYVVGLFSSVVYDNLPDEERSAFEGDDGRIDEETILGAVEGATIELTRHFEDPVHAGVYFSVSWDEEHVIEAQLDEAGQILRWF